jgi:FtsP/CotA-like multicopper oxidase with cupredoxin domain
MNHENSLWRRVAQTAGALTGLLACLGPAHAAVPGINGASFDLVATAGRTSQPDGAMIYTWGYGCNTAPASTAFLPAQTQSSANCPTMQLPGPTLIVTAGMPVTVRLTNKLPGAAGPTSIVFPGQTVTVAATDPGVPGVLTTEAAASDCASDPLKTCGSVTYTFTPTTPGTYGYHSGTRPELQVEMGLYGALIVLPATSSNIPASCKQGPYSLAKAAYDHASACYDREYLFQFSEISSVIHDQVEAQLAACGAANCPALTVATDPYRPNYYLINGRSMPDLMDVPYSPAYRNQPYNGNPHMHPGEIVLMRNIGHGRWQHPFHFHGNHARMLARDGNLLVSATDATKLAGPLLFTLPTLPGQTADLLYSWTGQGLNWDVYGTAAHTCNGVTVAQAANPNPTQSTALKANGGFDAMTKEYCLDHGKGIPVIPPDPNIVANGQWYGGTPYLGLSNFDPTQLAPGTLNQNPNAGYAFMWHSHNEREITTNDVFPGGMMMMLIIDPYPSAGSNISDIDETL